MDALGIDDELVLCAAAGVLAGLDEQRAVVHDHALFALQRMLIELRDRQVAVDRFGMDDAEMFEIHIVFSFSK